MELRRRMNSIIDLKVPWVVKVVEFLLCTVGTLKPKKRKNTITTNILHEIGINYEK